MIKYVHYEGSLLDSSAMISDNENETAKDIISIWRLTLLVLRGYYRQ